MTKKKVSVGSRTYDLEPAMVSLHEMIPNPSQPRVANILDNGLRNSISETRGLVQSLLLERLPKDGGKLMAELRKRYTDRVVLEFMEKLHPKYLIIDGERRWANSVRLLSDDSDAQEYLKLVPCDIIEGKLTKEDRYILWVSIHKLRKEWKAIEKETAAYKLLQMMNPSQAANFLGITVTQLNKFVEAYKLSKRMEKADKPQAISYARETMNLAQKYRTEETVNAIVDKVNRGLISNAVSIRRLRSILQDQEARETFLRPEGTIDNAAAVLADAQPRERPITPHPRGFRETVRNFRESIQKLSWVDLEPLKEDTAIKEEIDSTISLLRRIKRLSG